MVPWWCPSSPTDINISSIATAAEAAVLLENVVLPRAFSQNDEGIGAGHAVPLSPDKALPQVKIASPAVVLLLWRKPDGEVLEVGESFRLLFDFDQRRKVPVESSTVRSGLVTAGL